MNVIKIISNTILICIFMQLSVVAEVVVSHNDDTDPVNEGWTVVKNPGVVTGPDSETSSWSVDDQSGAPGSHGGYRYILDECVADDARNNGWELSLDLQVATDGNDNLNGSPYIGFSDGDTVWQVLFGLNDNGDTVVQLDSGKGSGPVMTVPGNDFNSYNLKYNPLNRTATLIVNGAPELEYSGLLFSTLPEVSWGAGFSYDIGKGNFRNVSFAVNNTTRYRLLLSHSGSENPEEEGWQSSFDSRVVTGPEFSDGIESWMVDDTSRGLGSRGVYYYDFSSCTAQTGREKGWVLDLDLKVSSDGNLNMQGSPFMAYYDGNRLWQLLFGLDESGNTRVVLDNGSEPSIPIIVPGNNYHNYQLSYNWRSETVSLYINGKYASDYEGVLNSSPPRLEWGAGFSYDIGKGNFNGIEFSIKRNLAPVLADLTDVSVSAGEETSITISAEDPDGHALFYQAGNLPAGAEFDAETGRFNWVPGQDISGDFHITFTVTDNGVPALSDSRTVLIQVKEVECSYKKPHPGMEVLYNKLLTWLAEDSKKSRKSRFRRFILHITAIIEKRREKRRSRC